MTVTPDSGGRLISGPPRSLRLATVTHNHNSTVLHHSLVLGHNAMSGTVPSVLFLKLVLATPSGQGAVSLRLGYSWVRALVRAILNQSTNELRRVKLTV